MSGQRFSSGKRFRWQGVTYEVSRLLPNGQVNIEDIFSGAVAVVELSELVTALFDGQLQFAIEGKQAKQNKRKKSVSLVNTLT